MYTELFSRLVRSVQKLVNFFPHPTFLSLASLGNQSKRWNGSIAANPSHDYHQSQEKDRKKDRQKNWLKEWIMKRWHFFLDEKYLRSSFFWSFQYFDHLSLFYAQVVIWSLYDSIRSFKVHLIMQLVFTEIGPLALRLSDTSNGVWILVELSHA